MINSVLTPSSPINSRTFKQVGLTPPVSITHALIAVIWNLGCESSWMPQSASNEMLFLKTPSINGSASKGASFVIDIDLGGTIIRASGSPVPGECATCFPSSRQFGSPRYSSLRGCGSRYPFNASQTSELLVREVSDGKFQQTDLYGPRTIL
jgi:hypothetical protein